MPRLLGVKIDGAHDFASIAYRWRFYVLPAVAVALLAIVVCARGRIAEAARRLREPHYALLALCALALLCAIVLDLRPRPAPLNVVEEMLEMNAAFALCCCALSLRRRRCTAAATT